MWYIYAAIAFWGFDRFIRVARLLCFGFQLATITLLPGETMRVVISKPKIGSLVLALMCLFHFSLLNIFGNHIHSQYLLPLNQL